MLKKILLGALLASTALSAAGDELTAEKRADIDKLIEVTGLKDRMAQMMNGVLTPMLQAMLVSHPEIPQATIKKMGDRIATLMSQSFSGPGDFLNSIISIYANHYSDAEIRDILAFYQTPTGKKLLATLPEVMQESMTAGQQAGKALGPQIEEVMKATLKEDGVELKKPPPKS